MPTPAPDDEPVGPTSAAAPIAVLGGDGLIRHFDDVDDGTALELRRARLLWERRLHFPLKVAIVGAPASCTGIAVIGGPVEPAAMAAAAVVVVAFLASVVVVPFTLGVVREECRQRGVHPSVLGVLRRVDREPWRAGSDADQRFLVSLHQARERERAHRTRPTLVSRVRRFLLGP